jgi:hypothetical protein
MADRSSNFDLANYRDRGARYEPLDPIAPRRHRRLGCFPLKCRLSRPTIILINAADLRERVNVRAIRGFPRRGVELSSNRL